MANIPIIPNLKYKGTLNMFGSVYIYILEIQDADSGSFSYRHTIKNELGGIVDAKSGEGTFKVLQEDNVEIRYEDPETVFSGILIPSQETIKGETTQKNTSMFGGSTGTFQLKVETQ